MAANMLAPSYTTRRRAGLHTGYFEFLRQPPASRSAATAAPSSYSPNQEAPTGACSNQSGWRHLTAEEQADCMLEVPRTSRSTTQMKPGYNLQDTSEGACSCIAGMTTANRSIAKMQWLSTQPRSGTSVVAVALPLSLAYRWRPDSHTSTGQAQKTPDGLCRSALPPTACVLALVCSPLN